MSYVCSGESVPTGVGGAREKMVSATPYLIRSLRLWEAVEERCSDSRGCSKGTRNHRGRIVGNHRCPGSSRASRRKEPEEMNTTQGKPPPSKPKSFRVEAGGEQLGQKS